MIEAYGKEVKCDLPESKSVSANLTTEQKKYLYEWVKKVMVKYKQSKKPFEVPVLDSLRFRVYSENLNELVKMIELFKTKFKVVRLKNKMNGPLHQVLINFYFEVPEKNLKTICEG